MNKARIIRGADFLLTLNIAEKLYPEGTLIQTSSANIPAIIETQLPHGLTTNDRVKISGHRKNTIVNGIHSAFVIDQFRFSVPVEGAVSGFATGIIGKLINISGYTFSGRILTRHGGTEIGVPELSYPANEDGEVLITIPKAATETITGRSCVVEITYTDTNDITDIISIECEVVNG